MIAVKVSLQDCTARCILSVWSQASMVRDTLAMAYQHDTTNEGKSLAICDRESLGIWRQGAECNGREAVNAGQIK